LEGKLAVSSGKGDDEVRFKSLNFRMLRLAALTQWLLGSTRIGAELIKKLL
jgi:hypothetical protein